MFVKKTLQTRHLKKRILWKALYLVDRIYILLLNVSLKDGEAAAIDYG